MKNCPNCGKPIKGHVSDGCILYELIDVIRARGEITDAEVEKLHADADADSLWNDLGPIVDRLQAGEYSQ